MQLEFNKREKGGIPGTSLDKCIQTIHKCKVYFGSIVIQYGNIEESSRKSFTELEYDETIKNKLPVLVLG